MRDFATFVLLDGLLLFGLFYGVTFVLALAQQHANIQGLTQRLRSTRLGRGTVYAAIAGAVTPFCSCSTIPVFAGMVRARIRFGVSMTFLMSSPLVDEAVVIVMWRYFGLTFTALFVLLSSGFSILAGIALDLLGFDRFLKERQDEVIEGEVTSEGNRTVIPWQARARFAHVLAWNELRSVSGYILIGLTIGGAIHGFIPQGWIVAVTDRVGKGLLIPVMALLGAPLYFNAAAAVPVAFALTEKGLGVGPVMAFLVAGSGMGVPEMILLSKLFRPQLMTAWFVSMLSIAITMGYFFNLIS